ncbi:hypothetical protein NY486_17805, partial [Enterobacter hormaechei]|nr:hypothetical protein [Enterobacter hormaechei]
ATPEPIEGFKNRLLTRIRVLSVGGRAPGSCGMDWHPAQHHEMKAALRKLMRNVHTVRIVLPIPHDEDDIL